MKQNLYQHTFPNLLLLRYSKYLLMQFTIYNRSDCLSILA